MKTLLRIAIALFMLQTAHLSFAGDKPDKPVWAIDIKTKGKQKDQFYYLHELSKSASNIDVQFTYKNEILITYFRHEFPDDKNTDLKTPKTTFVTLLLHGESGALIKYIEWPVEVCKQNSEINVRFIREDKVLITFFQHEKPENGVKTNTGKSKTTFVALLLHRATGDLVKRVEWPIHDSKWFHFYTFPQDIYLVRINNILQALDSSLNVVHSKTLELLPQNYQHNIIIPSSGYFFVVEQLGKESNYEIVDWRTFETVEKKINAPNANIKISDIWNDRLLARGSQEGIYTYTWLLEKKIGTSSWVNFGVNLPRQPSLNDAKFFYNGTVVVQGRLNDILPSQRRVHTFWFVMENGRGSNYAIYGEKKDEFILSVFPAKQGSVLEVIVFKPALDIFDTGKAGASWTDYWDVTTQQRLRPKIEKNVIGKALSSDGRSLVRLTEKKLEMYAISEASAKKK